MLTTDAYAFLNIESPVCAWATYRGTLVSAPNEPGFVSVWTAGLLQTTEFRRLNFETKIEAVRVAQFPDRISRLRGMFCVLDQEDAMKALSWGHAGKTHFELQYLAELNLSEAGSRRDRLDANWITYATMSDDGSPEDPIWIAKYWLGEPYPGQTPTWETLVEGRMTVLGTDIRKAAYENVKSEFPESLMFLEIARQAAWVGSDLGSVCAFLQAEGDEVVLKYLMNMLDADNPEFIEKLKALRESGHPINHADLKPHIELGSFGRTPNLMPYGFRRSMEIPAS